MYVDHKHSPAWDSILMLYRFPLTIDMKKVEKIELSLITCSTIKKYTLMILRIYFVNDILKSVSDM